MRVSIRPYLHNWVNEVGEQMGCEDVTEVVNHLLREHKRLLAQQATGTSNSNEINKLTDVLSDEFSLWK